MLPLSPGTLALNTDTGAAFVLGKQVRAGHGAVVSMGPGEGRRCGSLQKRRVIFFLKGMYLTRFQCPVGHLHPDARPGSLCVR